MKHGEPDGDGFRFCDEHGLHGPLYPCPAYGAEILEEIAESDRRYRAALNTPKWIERQLRKGIPPDAIAVFQALAGPPDEDFLRLPDDDPGPWIEELSHKTEE